MVVESHCGIAERAYCLEPQVDPNFHPSKFNREHVLHPFSAYLCKMGFMTPICQSDDLAAIKRKLDLDWWT